MSPAAAVSIPAGLRYPEHNKMTCPDLHLENAL
jgi:hypothetical protein